jgi:hypothetical protein
MMHDLRRDAASLALTLVLATVPVPLLAEDVRIPGVQSTAELADPNLKALRKRMVDGRTLRPAELRALADAGDGLAAFNLAKILDEAAGGDATREASNRVHYFSIAVYTGREFAVPPLLRVMRGIDDPVGVLGPVRLKGVEDALIVAARRGSAEAAVGLAVYYAEGTLFGARPDEARALLLSVSGDNSVDSAEAALQLALQAIGPDPSQPANPDLAREMLEIAASSSDLGVRATAENLQRLLATAAAVPAVPVPTLVEVTQ